MKMRIKETPISHDKAKKWLWRYRKAKLDVLGLEAEYQTLTIAQESASSAGYDGMPSSHVPIDLSSYFVARERIMERLNRRRRDMSQACVEIVELADKLEPRERDILLLRYLHLKDGYGVNSMADVAALVGYSISQTKRIHASALANVEKMIPDGPR